MLDKRLTRWGRQLALCGLILFISLAAGCGNKNQTAATRSRSRSQPPPGRTSERLSGRAAAGRAAGSQVVDNFEEANRIEERRLWDMFVKEQAGGRTHESFDEFKLRLTKPPADATTAVEDADITAEMATLNSMHIPERSAASESSGTPAMPNQ